jgi:hypothetical protein
MRKWAVFVFLCGVGFSVIHESRASHIVGGEFELIHQSGMKYKLNLNLYFDVLNGNPGAQENSILVALFRKRDNLRIGSIRLPLVSQSRVDYFQPDCSNGEVVTDKMVYSTDINLPEAEFNDPGGYYVVWERCCRNYNITNIYSQDPAVGTYAGQAFYLEFPPVTKNGESFINSSPILFPPLNDYACPYRPYWVDFQGTDPDGDSLVYSLETPLNTTTGEAVVAGGANPGPYPGINWKPNFGLDNILYGAPDLEISSDGFLTVTPTVQGLFVFAVKVEEYRDSVKIGEVRRDFQLLVVDKCPEAEAPVIKGKKINDAGFSYRENMSVTFPASTPDEERCIEVQITDPDAAKISDNYTENVYIQAIPLGFKEDVEGLLPEDFEATLVNGSDATFKICFEECPYLRSGSFQIGIVAFDDACSLPLSDTLRIDVYVEPPPNKQAYFLDGNELNITVQEEEDGLLMRDILARDDDNDSLTLDITPVGFNPDDFGISLTQGNNQPGEAEALLEWNYDCQKFSYESQTEFPFILTVDDDDKCQLADPVDLKVNLKIELPPNTKPDVNISINPDNDNYHHIEAEINSTINFNVTATDEDNDVITLEGEGVNFNFSENDIIFPEKEGNGIPGLQSSFSWSIPCDFDISENDPLRIHFYTEDSDKCQIENQDTIVVDVKLSPPPSVKPTINAFALDQTTLRNNSVDIFVGERISLRLIGADQDIDSITLSLVNPEDLPEAEFPEKTDKGQVSSNFIWTPYCDVLQEQDSVTVPAKFMVMDDNCYIAKGDTLEMNFTVRDTDNKEERFRPPNVITPNNDQYNQYFALDNIFDKATGEERSMPEDNCAGKFQHIEIYNRWGRNIFISREREFKWTPDKEPPGVYYYYLKYSNKTYKGVISVLF